MEVPEDDFSLGHVQSQLAPDRDGGVAVGVYGLNVHADMTVRIGSRAARKHWPLAEIGPVGI